MDFGSSVDIVDHTIFAALDIGASDIHFEHHVDSLRVRFRIDGLLHDQNAISKENAASIIARVKVLSGLNTAERRIPQDGKFSINHLNRLIDIRVATFPCIGGERVVLRLLDGQEQSFTLNNLGISPDVQKKITKYVNFNQGCILVTGPTGSGKTTTLHALLKLLSEQSKHIISLEDPVEYTVKNISQAQIRPEVGFSFENALRAVLRQDPDVIMIGEIRDSVTAHSALRASLTGHLVLSSVHTGDTIGVIARLLDMGLEPFFISHALNAVLAQRLVRKLCNNCKFSQVLNDEEKQICQRLSISIDQAFISSGCDNCNNFGYKGRIGIFEFLEISNNLRSLLLLKPSREELLTQAYNDGLKPLISQAQNILMSGQTSLFEIARALL